MIKLYDAIFDNLISVGKKLIHEDYMERTLNIYSIHEPALIWEQIKDAVFYDYDEDTYNALDEYFAEDVIWTLTEYLRDRYNVEY